MKIFAGIIALLLIYSCSGEEPEIPPVVSSRIEKYDTLIDQIKSQGAMRLGRFSMRKTDWKKFPQADLTFVRALMLRSVNNNDTLPTDSLSVYHIYDFNDLDTLFLFSIVRCDPSGYSSLYHFTFDKLHQKLSACTLIGTTIEAKGNICNDKLSFAKDGKSLIVNSTEVITEKNMVITDNCSVRYDFYRDSTTSRLLHNAHREKPKEVKRLKS